LENFDIATRLIYLGNNADAIANRERYMDIYYTYGEYKIEDGYPVLYSTRIEAVPCAADRFGQAYD
jgi:hypothetical protein